MKAARSASKASSKAATKAKAKPSAKAAKKAPGKAVKKPLKAAPAPSAKAIKKAEAADLSLKKILQNPLEAFLAKWKPKSETFEAGLERFLTDLKVPPKEWALYWDDLASKIRIPLRKESLGAAIEEQLMERFPRDRVHKLATIFSMRPKTAGRLNYLKADINGFSQSLAARDLKIKRGSLSPWGFEIGKDDDLAKHPIVERGLMEIQDESSQLVALLTNARPGQRVLDLCAGDGSNALAISTMMRNKGSVFVYESDIKRLKGFKERAFRAGIDNFRIVSDSQIAEVKSVDIALVHAPSSGLGDLAHRPELKLKFQKDDLTRLHKLQAALLREGARKLKLGGHIVYATSTLTKSENEAQIENFLRSSHNSYRLIPIYSYLKDYVIPYVTNFFGFQWDEKILQTFAESDPFMVLSPDVHGSTGMFVAILQRSRIST